MKAGWLMIAVAPGGGQRAIWRRTRGVATAEPFTFMTKLTVVCEDKDDMITEVDRPMLECFMLNLSPNRRYSFSLNIWTSIQLNYIITLLLRSQLLHSMMS